MQQGVSRWPRAVAVSVALVSHGLVALVRDERCMGTVAMITSSFVPALVGLRRHVERDIGGSCCELIAASTVGKCRMTNGLVTGCSGYGRSRRPLGPFGAERSDDHRIELCSGAASRS